MDGGRIEGPILIPRVLTDEWDRISLSYFIRRLLSRMDDLDAK